MPDSSLLDNITATLLPDILNLISFYRMTTCPVQAAYVNVQLQTGSDFPRFLISQVYALLSLHREHFLRSTCHGLRRCQL